MKLFSRKSLVATAASAALFAGALTVPASAEETTSVATTTEETSTQETTTQETTTQETTTVTADPISEPEPEEELSSSEEFISGSSDEDGNLKASAIRDWIAVFTAIIGALSTVFVFTERLNK